MLRETTRTPADSDVPSPSPSAEKVYPYGPYVIVIDSFKRFEGSVATEVGQQLANPRLRITTELHEGMSKVVRSDRPAEVRLIDGSSLFAWANRSTAGQSSPVDRQHYQQLADQLVKADVKKIVVVDDPFDPDLRYKRGRYFEGLEAVAASGIEIDVVSDATNKEDVAAHVVGGIQPVITQLREIREIARLEQKSSVADVLKSHPAIAGADGTMLHWLSGVMVRSSKKHVVKNWRAIGKRRGRTSADFSSHQKGVLSIDARDIRALHDEVKKSPTTSSPVARYAALDHVYGKYGHRWNDKYEQRQVAKRSLEMLREKGIEIKIAPEDVALIKAEYTPDAECAILDRVKNNRIASINGLTGSKLSLSIHDIFDHFWGFDTLAQKGVLDRYSSFLHRVGNPQNTDLFKREGELIGSILFEWRSSHLPERQFKPIFALPDIIKVLQKAQKANGLSSNQQAALEVLYTLDPNSDEARRLPVIYSGIMVELMEQRRKNGFIRDLSNSSSQGGVLPLLDGEYTALVVEVNHILSEQNTQPEKVLFNIEAIIEDYLIGLADGTSPEVLTVTPAAIESFDVEASRLSGPRREWLKKNIFHAATRQLMAA